jgi:hypothetical protein
LIEKFFYPLLRRAVPALYAAADRTRPPKFLNKEFLDVLDTGDPKLHRRPRVADAVAEVPLRDGGSEYVILHAEAQGPGGGDLSARMSLYRAAIFVHYMKEPVALAIVTGHRPQGEPSFYSHRHYGTESVYRYNNLVLLELDDDDLLSSGNPIDLALYAAKCAARAGGDAQKFQYLRKTVRLLADQGWNEDETRELLLFIEWILFIRDDELGDRYEAFRRELKEEGKIVYIPFYERKQAQKVWQEGQAEGKAEGSEMQAAQMAKYLYENGVALDVIAKSAKMPLDKIKSFVS